MKHKSYKIAGIVAVALLAVAATALLTNGSDSGQPRNGPVEGEMQVRPVRSRADSPCNTKGSYRGADSSPGCFILEDEVLLANDDVERASAQRVEPADWLVIVDLTPDGAQKLDAAAKRYYGKQLAVVLDGRVMTAATVQERTFGGAFSISAAEWDERDARQVANAISARSAEQ